MTSQNCSAYMDFLIHCVHSSFYTLSQHSSKRFPLPSNKMRIIIPWILSNPTLTWINILYKYLTRITNKEEPNRKRQTLSDFPLNQMVERILGGIHFTNTQCTRAIRIKWTRKVENYWDRCHWPLSLSFFLSLEFSRRWKTQLTEWWQDDENTINAIVCNALRY